MVSIVSGTPGLILGAVGIYTAFLYYGSLQEDVFDFEDHSGSRFTQVWLLMAIEALSNVLVGFVGMRIAGRTVGLPLRLFCCSGATQVTGKAAMSGALASGLSFPVATLCKSAKMAPVMLGGVFIGGQRYSARQYLQVFAIITSAVMVSMNSAKAGGKGSSALGVIYISLSLACDGFTAGVQDKIKKVSKERGAKVKPYDMMFWSNMAMLLVALFVALVLGQMSHGLAFIAANPEILTKVLAFAACSAMGQSFVFFVIAEYGALKCATVTTTRKIMSVMLSIFTKGHALNPVGWFGVILGSIGIAGELLPERRTEVASIDASRTVLADATSPFTESRPSSTVCLQLSSSSSEMITDEPELVSSSSEITSNAPLDAVPFNQQMPAISTWGSRQTTAGTTHARSADDKAEYTA